MQCETLFHFILFILFRSESPELIKVLIEKNEMVCSLNLFYGQTFFLVHKYLLSKLMDRSKINLKVKETKI